MCAAISVFIGVGVFFSNLLLHFLYSFVPLAYISFVYALHLNGGWHLMMVVVVMVRATLVSDNLVVLCLPCLPHFANTLNDIENGV